MRITICGGGNLGHVCAGFLSAQNKNQVSLLTRRPELWSKKIDVIDCNGTIYRGELVRVSKSPSEVIPDAEMVLVCLPGYAIEDGLQGIAPYLSQSCLVGSVVSSSGFFFAAFKELSACQPLFGFQRVPFISRITKYGQLAELKGYKDSLSVAIEHATDRETVREILERLFLTPVKLLSSHYEASLSNSNPLLHTSRLYTLWHNWKPGVSYRRNPGFYTEWTKEASELYIVMDKEFQRLLNKLGLAEGCISSVLEYYECSDADALTKKIRSIPAFQGILSPMVSDKSGMYVPDFTSRYFTEDFPYGLRFIVERGEELNMDMPRSKIVYQWGIRCLLFERQI